MIRKAIVLSMLLPAALTAADARAADVRASASIDLGGLYGRIDIGGVPPPVLVYPEPVVVQVAPQPVARQPIYLRVPPGHARNWSRHCARYQACGQPVYFVQEDWYQSTYLPIRQGHGGSAHRGASRPASPLLVTAPGVVVDPRGGQRHQAVAGPGPRGAPAKRGHDKHDKHDKRRGH